MNHVKLKNLPKSDRPYEKFLDLGAHALTDSELLSIIIRTGNRELSAVEVVHQILSGKQNNILNIYEFTVDELCRFPGIGKVKAIQIKAIAELSRRISKTKSGYNLKMNSPLSIANYYMEQLRHKDEEHFFVAYFDTACNFLGDEHLSIGCVNSAFVSPREIFKKALSKNAVALVMIHNHPSGNPTASKEDKRITKRVQECGDLLGIKVIDHIIIGDNRYFSFKEEKIIE